MERSNIVQSTPAFMRLQRLGASNWGTGTNRSVFGRPLRTSLVKACYFPSFFHGKSATSAAGARMTALIDLRQCLGYGAATWKARVFSAHRLHFHTTSTCDTKTRHSTRNCLCRLGSSQPRTTADCSPKVKRQPAGRRTERSPA